MRRGWQPATVLTAAFLGVAACRLPETIVAPPPETAAAIYQQACAGCHGANARGAGPAAASLAAAPTDLTTLAARHGGRFPRAYVIDVVTGATPIPSHGPREMPVWGARFEPTDSGGAAVASVVARRRMELLADHLEGVQGPAP